jgi:hypothetical protein
MMFQMFSTMRHRYIDPEKLEAESTKKIRANLYFPDLLRVKVFYACPDEPFTHTCFLIDDMDMRIKMNITMFSSYVQNALNSDLFSKISLN